MRPAHPRQKRSFCRRGPVGGVAVSAEILIEGTVVEVAQRRKPSRRTIIIAAAAAVLLAAGGGYAFMSGGEAEEAEAAPEEGADAKTAAGVSYVEAPEMMVNLRGADGATRFLKLRFMIVPASPAKSEAIRTKLPLLIDAYQPFLRELRPEDLAGSAAIFRIKEEMMARAVTQLGAGVVKDILIQDIVQQ